MQDFENFEEALKYVSSLPAGTILFWQYCGYVWIKTDKANQTWRCISSSRLGDLVGGVIIASDMVNDLEQWVVM